MRMCLSLIVEFIGGLLQLITRFKGVIIISTVQEEEIQRRWFIPVKAPAVWYKFNFSKYDYIMQNLLRIKINYFADMK